MRTTTMMASVCSTSTRRPQQRNDPIEENQQPRSVKGESCILGDSGTTWAKSTPSYKIQAKVSEIYQNPFYCEVWIVNMIIDYSFKAACSSSCSCSHCTKEATSGSFLLFSQEIILSILFVQWVGFSFVTVFSIILWPDFCQVAYGFIRKRPKVFHWRSNPLKIIIGTLEKVTAVLRPRVGTSPFLEGLGSRWGSTIQHPTSPATYSSRPFG